MAGIAVGIGLTAGAGALIGLAAVAAAIVDAAVDQSLDAHSVRAALDVGDRAYAHRCGDSRIAGDAGRAGPVSAGITRIAVGAGIAVRAILGGCLGHGRGGAARHCLAVADIVAVAEQRIDDLANWILGSVALVRAGIALLGVAVSRLAGVKLRVLLILLLILGIGRLPGIILRRCRSRE